MDRVLFASAHVDRLAADASLPAKFRRLLGQADFASKFANKRVAVKMHVGGGIGFYTIHPIFVRTVVDAINSAGGSCFLCDGSFSTDAAVARGYVPEVVGARVTGVGGEFDKYVYRRDVGIPGLPPVELSGNIVDADALLVLSHGKGHGQAAFGGAIKNIAMGCVSCKTRGDIHALMAGHFEWDGELCTHCGQCISGCPTSAIQFNADDRIAISEHHCRYCMHCTTACPTGALTMEQPEEKFRQFQRGMAAVVRATLAEFEPSATYFITVLMNITPLCDCWGFSTQPLVPDIGIVASDNIVAAEKSAIDLIDYRNLIEAAVPEELVPLGTEGHLLQRIWGKDPYEQVRAAVEAGLGSGEYELVAVE